MGADKGVHLVDNPIADSDFGYLAGCWPRRLETSPSRRWSTWTSGRMASTDATGSVIPAILAERVDLPQVGRRR